MIFVCFFGWVLQASAIIQFWRGLQKARRMGRCQENSPILPRRLAKVEGGTADGCTDKSEKADCLDP